jgi:DNA-binding MarR family transcriptional regulator
MTMSKLRRIPYAETLMVRDACLCLHVHRAARVLARRFDDAFRPLGVTSGQFSLLMSLNRPEPPNLSAVADLLAMDRTTLTAAVKPLEKRGLVKVSVDPKDRRNRLLALSASGRAILAKALPIWTGEHARIQAALASGGPDRLRRDLNALNA